MRVDVHLLHQSQPVHFDEVRNTYQKGDFFCVMSQTGRVAKFPLLHVFRVLEYEDEQPPATPSLYEPHHRGYL